MHEYAEHAPDFADAFLVAWHERQRSSSIWTFDQEFRTTWRTLKGQRVRLATR